MERSSLPCVSSLQILSMPSPLTSYVPWGLCSGPFQNSLSTSITYAVILLAHACAPFTNFSVRRGRSSRKWRINGFKAKLFHTPPRSVKFLRRLAQQECTFLKYSMHEQNSKPKRVWGILNHAEMVGPLVAQAHRRITDAIKPSVPGTAKTLSQKQ